MLAVRSFLLSVRMDGLRVTIRRGWARLFGREEWYVFVRHLEPPARPPASFVEINGITVRSMRTDDLDAVAQLIPFELDRRPLRERRERIGRQLAEAFVATRAGQIIGAVWYADVVADEQPWYDVVKSHLALPARLTVNIFAVPGVKGATLIMAKHANERLAAAGVRSIVGVVQAHNTPSMLISRLLGGKIVAHRSVRYRLGRRTDVIEPAVDARAFSADKPS